MRWLTIIGAFVALAFVGCVAPEPGEAVGPDVVQNDLAGKIWRVELPDGQPAIEYFNKDGTVIIAGGLNDSGHWRLWDKGFCSSWSRMRAGAERCFTLDRTAGGHYRIYKPSGEISMTIVGFK